MATVGNLKIKISADDGGLKGKLQKVEKTLQKASRRMSAVGRDLSMTLTASIGGLGFAAIDAAMDFEVLETQLSVLTGSAEEGAKAFKKIADFSAKTPFQLEDLVKANNTMLGFGMASDEAFQSLQMIGDAVAATGGDMQRVTVAFSQSIAANKVNTRDLLQMVNNNIPIIDMLADTLGVATGEVQDLAEEGKITGDVLKATFTQATSEGGRFAGATEKLAGTLRGVFSTVKDNIRLALGELGKDITESFDIKAIADKFAKSLQKVVAIFKALSPEQKKFVITMAAVLAAIGPVLVALGSLAGLLGIILSPIGLVTTAILALAAGFVVAFKRSEKFRNVVAKVGAFLRTWFKMKIQQIRDFADIFKKVFKGDFKGAFDSANKVLKGFTSSYTEAFKAARDASGDDIIDIDKLESNIEKAKDSVTGAFKKSEFNLPNVGGGESVFGKINEDYKKQSKELDNLRAAGLISEKDYNKQFEELQRSFLENLAKSGFAGTELYKQIADQYVRVRKETIQQIESIDSQFGGVGADMKKFLQGTADTAMKGGKQEGLISEYMLSKLTEYEQKAQSAIQTLGGLFDSINSRQASVIENQYRSQIHAVNQLGLSEEQRIKRISKLEEEKEKKLAKLQERRAKREKAFAILSATIGTALAVISQMRVPGVGIAQAIAANAMGIAQIATIAAAPIPKFADGGIVSGRTLAEVGEYAGASSNPEVIAPLDKLRSMISDLGGGATFGEFRLRGEDLILAVDRANKNSGRYSGNNQLF